MAAVINISFPVIASFCTVTYRPARSRLRLLTRNDLSGDDPVSPVEEEVEVLEAGTPASLISAVNVDKVLRGIAITDGDHYGTLGVERGCSFDEVRVAYKNKLLALDLDEKQLDLLKESYRILGTAEERRLYDWSLARNENPDRYIWPFEVDKLTPIVSTDNPPSLQPPEDVRPTTWLGYFFFAWFFLSIVFLVRFNT
ncbi:NAD(P)H-quinone oxidoreductase subunit U, chloroplastic [Primulina huaijiensis]|uniref:NAD(P)H-quinone oxidoreductase subunit U, chloroplastic n=1 Tax=Primulina huaijiensis TaxID=1492673 RepID=UPI003CC77805